MKKFIHVGEIYIATEATEIATVLGSCIAVCLFDRVRKIGGINHYLVPLWNGNGLQSPKYGNISIPKMIEAMEENGSNIRNLEAKLFGGSNISNTVLENMMVGKKNIIIAKEILKEYGIPIVAEDVGGYKGRRILLKSDTGKVLMKYTAES